MNLESWWIFWHIQTGLYVELIAWIFWVLLSVTLHELGHGFAAIRQGDRTPIELDRMTLSPFVHMGSLSIAMFVICGFCWGMMPVNPHRFRDGFKGDMIVSAAGPAVNLGLAVVCTVLCGLWVGLGPSDAEWHFHVTVFLHTGAFLNFFLFAFNLLPIPPLDGGHVLSAKFMRFRNLWRHEHSHIFGLGILMLIFLTPVGDYVWFAARGTTVWGSDAIGQALDGPSTNAVLLAPHADLSLRETEMMLRQFEQMDLDPWETVEP